MPEVNSLKGFGMVFLGGVAAALIMYFARPIINPVKSAMRGGAA